MKVVGFERLSTALDEEVGSTWVIPPRHSTQDLSEYKDLINKAELDPPTFEDGETAEDQIRRKTAPRKKAVYDDDEEDDGANAFLDDGGEALFPKNLPSKKLVGPGQDKPGKRRRIQRKRDALGSEEDELPSEEEDKIRADKARKRRKRELDKQRKIKSALYVSPSDDEDDPERDAEFFAREEAIRQRIQKTLQFAPTDVSQLQESVAPPAAIAETMRRLMADTDDEDEHEDASDSGKEAESSQKSKAKAGSRKRKSDALLVDDDGEDEITETSPPPAKKAAPQPNKKSRLGFLVDSSDEEDEDMDEPHPSSLSHATDDAEEEENAGRDSDNEMETDETPLSSNPRDADKEGGTVEGRSPLGERDTNTKAALSEDGEDDDIVVSTKQRPKVEGRLVLDDSDEE